MSIERAETGIPPELAADTQAVLEHLAFGRSLDPEVARRVRDRGERIREEIFNKHGLLDIGVSAIRELRDVSSTSSIHA